MEQLKEFIQNELKELIFRTVDFDEALISTKTLDSIILIDLIVAIEEFADISIPTSDVNEENFETITIMSKFIMSIK